MSLDIIAKAAEAVGVPVYTGYASTGAKVPYVVARPLTADSTSYSVGGESLSWDDRYSLYAVAGSVVASHNLGLAIAQAVEGTRIGGNYVATSIGYIGALTEGSYETQITAQTTKGSLL